MGPTFRTTVLLASSMFMLVLMPSSALNYGELLHRIAAATATGKDAFGQFDLGSVKSFRAMLSEYVTSESATDTDSLCQHHINETMTALLQRQDWAEKMIDAAGKPSAGIETGNFVWIGSYDECVNITATVFTGPNQTNPTHPFKGKYCNAYKILKQNDTDPLDPTNVRLTYGICVPNSCSNTSIVQLTRGVFDYANCQEELEIDNRAIVAIVFLSFLGLLVLAGTAYDVFVIHKLHLSVDEEVSESSAPLIPSSDPRADNSSRNIRHRGYGSTETENQESGDNVQIVRIKKPAQIGVMGGLLQSFSVYTNGSKILSTESREGVLGAVNGVRFISMSWVILGHSYVFPLNTASNIILFLTESIHRLSFMTIYNASVSVDSFFTLSGLLVGYLTLRELTRVGSVRQFKWGMFFFHRFWRLTPPYMLVMLLYIPLFKYWNTGPFWPQQGIEQNYCEDTWWKNILYINNFFPMTKQCMGWSWYLANDMQFYVISPLLLIPLYLSNVVGGIICFVVLLTSWTATGVVSSTHHLPMGLRC